MGRAWVNLFFNGMVGVGLGYHPPKKIFPTGVELGYKKKFSSTHH